MAIAKKLSEALSELSNDSSISGDERIVVSDTDGKARTIPAKQLFASAQVNVFGSYSTWSDCQTALNGMATESSKSGRYVVKVGGVPYYVTLVLGASGVYWQMIEGGIVVKSDGTLGTDTTHYCTFVSRYYENGKWSAWRESAKKSDLPTAQSGTSGTNKNYVYSNASDNSHGCLSGTFKVFQYGGCCHIRHKFWGSSNDYSSDSMWVTREIPCANAGENGILHRNYFSRLINTTLSEANSTASQVGINYPNYAEGGVKTLFITAATSAKAGVMTAAQYNQLKSLSEASLSSRITDLESTEAGKRLAKIEKHYKYLGHFDSEDAALAKLTELSVCADTELLHAHLTYDNGSHVENSIILIQSISGTECRQIIYNKTKAFHRGLHFSSLERKEISMQEEWQFLFGDRLQWSTDGHKYVLSQFGQGFNHSITDSIPLASTSVDGLMSKEDKALLDKIKKQLNL